MSSFKPIAGLAWTIWGALKRFAPYAAIELVLPGGTFLAILYWLIRRRRAVSGSPAHQGSTLG